MAAAKRKFMSLIEVDANGEIIDVAENETEGTDRANGKVVSILTLQQVHKKYIKRCKSLRFADDTIKHYNDILHMLLLFREDTRISDINEDYWMEFIIWLNERDIASATVHAYSKTAKAFFNWMIDVGYIESFDMTVVSCTKKLKEIYTKDELNLLLEKPDIKKTTFAQYRAWVMVSYFTATGQRLRSVINLKIGDLDLEKGTVILRITKNKEETILPLSASLCEILKEYLKIRGGESNDYLFCKYNGKQMTKRGVEESIRLYNLKRGVDKSGIHLFRHTFAHNYLMQGGDVFRLQKLLCHKNINITKEYLNLTADDIKQDFDDLNLLDSYHKEHKKPEFRKRLKKITKENNKGE